MTTQHRFFWGLCRYRTCPVPTWRGWLVLLLAGAALGGVAGRGLHPFLAAHESLPGGVLVVEGWMVDYGIEAARAEFGRNHYTQLLVTGGPIDEGAPLCEYRTFAERGAAILLRLGMDTNQVQAVPAPLVARERTFTSGLSLRAWFQAHPQAPRKVNLVSQGAHARRSRLLFQKALGPDTQVGILAVEDRDYDPAHWWRSSSGVRTIMSEAVGYAYARFYFNPARE